MILKNDQTRNYNIFMDKDQFAGDIKIKKFLSPTTMHIKV